MNAKEQLINKILVFKAIADVTTDENKQKPRSHFDSIHNFGQNLLGFLIKLVNILVGTSQLIIVIGAILNNAITVFETAIVSIIGNRYRKALNSQDLLSTTCLTSGIDIPIANLDKFNLLKYKAFSRESTFTQTLRTAVQTGALTSLTPNLNVQYNAVTQILTVTKNGATPDITVFQLFTNDLQPLLTFDKNLIIEKVLNAIFGTESKNKNINDIENELVVQKYLDNLLNEYETQTITNFDFEKIRNEAKFVSTGNFFIDANCALIGFGADEQRILDLVNSDLSNIGDEELGNEILGILNDSNVDSSVNNPVTQDFYANNIITKIMIILLSESIFSHEFMFTKTIMDTLNDPTCSLVSNNDPLEDITDNSLVECLRDEVRDSIYEEFFKIVERESKTIIQKVIEKILKEQSQNYISIIKSLISL